MKRSSLLAFIFLLIASAFLQISFISKPIIPVLSQGRVIPLEEQIKKINLESNHVLSLSQKSILLALLKKASILKDEPLLKIPPSLQNILKIPSHKLFSWMEIDSKLNSNFINDYHQTLLINPSIELPNSGFPISFNIHHYPWNKGRIEKGNSIQSFTKKQIQDLYTLISSMQLLDHIDQLQISQNLQTNNPSYSLFLGLLGKKNNLWFNLFELNSLIESNDYNPLAYSSHTISQLRNALNEGLSISSMSLLDNGYREASKANPLLPDISRLHAHRFYIQSHLVLITIATLLTILFLFLITSINRLRNIKYFMYSLAAYLGWMILALRSYILLRPPVSSMLESIYFVAALLLSIGYYSLYKHFSKTVFLSLLTSLLLYSLAYIFYDHELAPLQPILASNFWLATHVLMVVSSYAFFIFAGLIAHCLIFYTDTLKRSNSLYKFMIQLLMAGVFLLTTGTLLGGVWASQSWGRFWDWDPKEAWAFISICYYLILIHAHYFNRASPLQVSYYAIGGVAAVSFTWYGVNYILGAGLHTYGFGEGGVSGYLIYLLSEGIICLIAYRKNKHKNLNYKN